MTRWLALAMAVLLAGCHSYPKTDPFQGPQVVPPPRTGTAGALVPPDESYYSENPSGPPAAPPAAPPAGTTAPTDPQYQPSDGSFNYGGKVSGSSAGEGSGRFRRPRGLAGEGGFSDDRGLADDRGPIPSAPLRSTGPDDGPPSGASSSSGTGGTRFEPPDTRFGPPSRYRRESESGPAGAAPASGYGDEPPQTRHEPRSRFRDDGGGARTQLTNDRRRFSSSIARTRGVRDILELPERGSLHGRGGGFRRVTPAGYTREVDAAGDRDMEPRDSREERGVSRRRSGSRRYGYASDYGWLKGKLEYSRIDRRWKLRYIPITGKTDDFGGSVVLQPDESALLDRFQPGDFVTVQGRVAENRPDGAFAPIYEPVTMQRIR